MLLSESLSRTLFGRTFRMLDFGVWVSADFFVMQNRRIGTIHDNRKEWRCLKVAPFSGIEPVKFADLTVQKDFGIAESMWDSAKLIFRRSPPTDFAWTEDMASERALLNSRLPWNSNLIESPEGYSQHFHWRRMEELNALHALLQQQAKTKSMGQFGMGAEFLSTV